ncbi:MAG: SsrA-binding protein SmpB [Candidatus Gracilibacteria bacterium]|nr:SsrA-binding protein SmpB [Candidatus Gracilibacteria bacterium]
MNDNLVTKNKKAYFDYDILETWEAGIELFGHEVKSIRSGYINLKGSYISFLGGQNLIKSLHITPWKTLVNRQNLPGNRDKKIFLHKKTISYLVGKQKEGGFAIIPLEVYFRGSLIKVKIGLCKGRKEYNKKQVLKERTLDKEAKIMMKKFI